MDVLTKVLSFVKGNWKNVSLCGLGGAVLVLSICLAAANGNNAQLKDALSAQTQEADAAADELKAAQDELETLKSQYTTMSEQVTPTDIFALNGVDASTGTVTAKKSEDGTIVYVDEESGEVLKNEDGSPLTYTDVQAIIAENESLKAENKNLTDTVSDLKANNSGSSSTPVTSATDMNTMNALASENENLQNQVNTLNGQVGALNNKVNALTEANNALSTLNDTLSSQLETATNQNTDLANASLKYATDLNNNVSSLEGDNAALSAELAEVSSSLDAYKTNLVTKMNELSDAKLNATILETNLNSLGSSLEDTEAQLEAVTNAYNELNGSIDSANIIEAYREAVDNLNEEIVSVQAQIDDINKKTEWSELDQAKYDTLQARLDAGDESLATADEMAAELLAMTEAHTLTEAEEQAVADLESQLSDLETRLGTATQELADAEAAWLTSDPNESLDSLLTADGALREKISTLEGEIAEKAELLEQAQANVSEIESEMYRLKESIKELEAQYGALSLEEKLAGSYETASGDIDFNLTGTTTEYNELVSAVESMITNLKNRVNNLLDYVDEMLNEIKNGLIEAGDDVTEETETIIGDDGNTYDVKVLKSKLIHKKVNIVLFRGSQDQITIKGQMPYGQITRTSGVDSTTKTYFETEVNGSGEEESTGLWGG